MLDFSDAVVLVTAMIVIRSQQLVAVVDALQAVLYLILDEPIPVLIRLLLFRIVIQEHVFASRQCPKSRIRLLFANQMVKMLFNIVFESLKVHYGGA